MFAGGLIVAVLSIHGDGTTRRAAVAPELADIEDATRIPAVSRGAEPSASGQLYPFSVVARGVHTLYGLRETMERDPVAADHYGPIAVESFRIERVAAPRLVYVSYRRGDEIYWTRNRVPLYAGENVLTDGTTFIRARCGNRISETPMEPTLDDEPSVVEFDRASDPDTPSGAGNVHASPNPVLSQGGALQEFADEFLPLEKPAALLPLILPLPPGLAPAVVQPPGLEPVAVPEPASATLLVLGLGTISMWRRRRHL